MQNNFNNFSEAPFVEFCGSKINVIQMPEALDNIFSWINLGKGTFIWEIFPECTG